MEVADCVQQRSANAGAFIGLFACDLNYTFEKTFFLVVLIEHKAVASRIEQFKYTDIVYVWMGIPHG